MARACRERVSANAGALEASHVDRLRKLLAESVASAAPGQVQRGRAGLLLQVGAERKDLDTVIAAARATLALSAYDRAAIKDSLAEVERALKTAGMSLRAAAGAKSLILRGAAKPDAADRSSDEVAVLWRKPFDPKALLGDEGIALVEKALSGMDPSDCLRRGRLLAWIGRRSEAAQEFDLAYAEAGDSDEGIVAAVKPAGKALVLWEGTLHAGDRYVAWRQFGPMGPDGKIRTADDLTDPFAAHLADK